MTYKAAVADLPLGGGKGVIMLPAGGPLTAERRHAALLDFADTVEALGGRYITAEDVGTSSRDMSVIAQRTALRRRARAPPRRLGRPEPVDRARRRDGDPGVLRAGVRLARRCAAAASA